MPGNRAHVKRSRVKSFNSTELNFGYEELARGLNQTETGTIF